MGLFGSDNVGIREDLKSLEAQVEQLQDEIKKLMRQREDAKDTLSLTNDIVTLRTQLVELEIEKDRVNEDNAREKREVEHMVGLERRRSEAEREMAQREARLNVREENLTAVSENLQKQIDFMVERFTNEVSYLKDEVLKTVISALPNINVELGRALTNGNGAKEPADVSS